MNEKTMPENTSPEKIPLVLLPGLLCDEQLWHHQIGALSDIADARVADLTREDNMADMARSVLARAPERFALAGLSMGGYVAMEIMRRAPERVERLALFDTTARPDATEQTERRKQMIALAEHGKFKGVTPKLLPALVHADHLHVPAVRDTVLNMAENVGKSGFIRQQHAIMGRIDSRPHLSSIECATLVVCGDSDAITPPEIMQEIVDGISGAVTFEIIQHAGHLPTLEQPDAVNAAMRRWLAV